MLSFEKVLLHFTRVHYDETGIQQIRTNHKVSLTVI